MTAVRVGLASADITPEAGGLMDGYGNRLSPSTGVHDPLSARALVLDYGDSACAIVVCDLLGVHPSLTAEVRRHAKDALGIPEDNVIVAATHNHAGPAGLRSGIFSRLDDGLKEATVGKITDALERAWSARRPATIKTGETTVAGVALNRRDPDTSVDETLRVVLFEGEGGVVATLMNFACHATVLTGANLELSGEFPAVACRIVEAATGACAIYVQGACGDVNPMWVQQDFASVERAGQAVGGAAVRLIADLRAAGEGLRSHNIRWDEFPERSVPGRVVEPRLRVARREIELPLREFETDEYYVGKIEEARVQVEASLAHREAAAQLSRYEGERWSAAWARRTGLVGTHRTEIQAISLGDGFGVIALPGEFFGETGALIRESAGLEQLLIAGYANEYVGYVVPERAFAEGGYESGITFFTGEAEAIIRERSIELLQEVFGIGG
ncbi:MAG: neutral/alkaline non-lysosomal ceramidase N-terminal domain-containing protein [Chloroflexota bacterium]